VGTGYITRRWGWLLDRRGTTTCTIWVHLHRSQIKNSFIHSQALIVQDGPLASFFGVSCSQTYRHTVGLLWTRQNKYRDCKVIKYTPDLDKIQDYKRKWIQHINRMPRNRLPRLTTPQKEPRKTTEETSGGVRPERVNKWPNSLIATWWWWWWWCLPVRVAVTLHTTLMLACCLTLRDVQVYAGLFDVFVTLHQDTTICWLEISNTFTERLYCFFLPHNSYAPLVLQPKTTTDFLEQAAYPRHHL
jgi:hypothetical protein